MQVQVGAVLALYTTGRVTGLAVDVGHGSSSIVPVYSMNGLPMGSSHEQSLSGHQINLKLQHAISERGIHMELPEVNMIKEQLCYVAQSDKQLNSLNNNVEFRMPDGGSVSIGDLQVVPLDVAV